MLYHLLEEDKFKGKPLLLVINVDGDNFVAQESQEKV